MDLPPAPRAAPGSPPPDLRARIARMDLLARRAYPSPQNSPVAPPRYKVCLAHHTLVTNDPYIKIYDLSFKVTQRLTGYLALDVTSLDKAERLFRIESEGLAGFSCRAGLMNGRTPAPEQEKLRAELMHNRGPLALRELL